MISFLNLGLFDSSLIHDGECEYPLIRLYEDEVEEAGPFQQFQLFSDSESVQMYSPKQQSSKKLLAGCEFNLKSSTKTRLTEGTRDESLDSLTEGSGLSKAISKNKPSARQAQPSKVAPAPPRSTKSSKKSQIHMNLAFKKSSKAEFSAKFKKEFLNVQPLKKSFANKTFSISSNQVDQQLRFSTFPLRYSVEYQQPVHGFEGKARVNIDQIDLTPAQKTNTRGRSKSVRAPQEVSRGVCFTNLREALEGSKAHNTKAGAACFETFKSLKVL